MARHITKITDLDERGQIFLQASLKLFFNGDEKALIEDFNQKVDELEKLSTDITTFQTASELIVKLPRQ